jgi:hypothetical protein
MPLADNRYLSALPVAGEAWPPPRFNPIGHQLRIWSAWLSGDIDMLAWTYYNISGDSTVGRAYFATTGERGLPVPRPGQWRTGIQGSLNRTFHGQPTPPGEKRVKYHIPLAGDIAGTSADLLFSRAPTITAESKGSQAALDQLMNDGTHATLLEAGELASALGGTFLRVVWDSDVSDRPWIDEVPADAAVPYFSYDKLKAVTFWRILSDSGDEVVRHLETHIPGENRIVHGVYVGDQSDLGRAYPLTDFPETRQFAQYLTAGDSIEFPDQPKDASTVAYVPNMRPNRIWRDLGPQAKPLGRSDYSGAETLLDGLDETFTSWMRDVQLAKSRLIVPNGYLDNIGRGKGAVWDPDRQIYSPVQAMTSGSVSNDIKASQFLIRYLEHQKTCHEIISQIVRRAGYSVGDFGEDDVGVAMTATEIESRERRSLITRDKKVLYWRPALRGILYGWTTVMSGMFGDATVTPERPEVDFGEVVLPDKLEMAQTAAALATAEAASKQTLVQMVHPDWTPDQVNEEVSRIYAEIGSDVLGRARITLAGPEGETLGQDIADMAAMVAPPAIPADVPGESLDQGGQ